MQALLNNIDTFLATALDNPYVNAALTLFFILYAGLAAPNLPPFIASLFESNLFKLLVLFLILVVRNYSTTVALLAALGFLLSLQTLSRYRLFGMTSDTLRGLVGMAPATSSPAAGGAGAGTAENEAQGADEQKALEAGEGVMGMDMGIGMGQDNCPPGGPVSCQDLACGQPLSQDAVFPPQDDTAVSGVCGCDWQGPQGLKHPYGYPGKICGAPYESDAPAGQVLPGA